MFLMGYIHVSLMEVCFCWSGMGVTTITAARILKGQLQNRTGEETVMNMDTFPYVGLAKVNARKPALTWHESTRNSLFLKWCKKTKI